MKYTRLCAVITVCMTWACHAQQQGISLIQKIDAFRMPYNEVLISTQITAYKNGKVDDTALFDAYITGNDKSLVVQKQGKNRDMKILYNKEKMWVQLPSAHKPIRITPIQRLIGQASNGDVARASYGTDYNAVEVRKEVYNKVQCRVINLTARKKSATYHKILLWVRASDYRPVKAEFYLVSGKHFKTAIYESYTKIEGRSVVQRMCVLDVVRKNRSTTFEYVKIEKKSIPKKYYNKNYLVHIRGL